MTNPPNVSVVIGLISGEQACLARCLQALADQTMPASEILVAYDEPCADVATLGSQFPGATFLPAVGLDTRAARAGASREHHDTLRTIGLRRARGEIVILTEDHAHAAPNWCAMLVAALARHPTAAAVGGAVECDSDRLLNWAVWFSDFGRYQNPLPEGPAYYVSDSNVAYRREALERVANLATDDYHETVVHGALIAAGMTLVTTPTAVAWQNRGALPFGTAFRERYVWGRSFAGTRARLLGSPKRFIFAALTPLLPFVKTGRIAKVAVTRGRLIGKLLQCLPLIFALETVWAVGELVGYLTADPG